jgi:hypothetical protein
MSFRTWAALAVFALVAAPLLAHLLRRRPPQEQQFAATKLVPVSPAVANRRAAIEDRALFGLRVLAVLALAVLGATPLLRCSKLSLARQSGASVALAIVLDDSLSMKAPTASAAGTIGAKKTRFELAVRGARELLGGMQQGDAVAVVMAGKPVRVVLAATTNLEAARSVLERTVPSDRGTDLEGAVRVASELVSGLQHVDKRVVVLSDLADGPTASLTAPEGIKLWAPLFDLRGELDDCAVVHADRQGARVTVRVGCTAKSLGLAPATASASATASATRAAASARPAAGRRVRIMAGSEALAEAPVSLEDIAGDMVFTLSDATLEKHATTQLYAEITGSDAIADDDAAPVIGTASQLRVGIVSDPAADRVPTGGPPLVEQAFRALDAGVQFSPMTTVPDRREELDTFAMIIADDVAGFTPAQRRELAGWIERGGVMLLTLGPRAAAAPLGSGFSPMVPALVRYKPSASKGIAKDTAAIFADASDGLDDLAPKARAVLELEEAHEQLGILARWDDGAPFLLERKLGRGVALSITLPFSSQESDFALRPAFFSLLSHAVGVARAIGGVARSNVGSSWSVSGFREASARRLARDDKGEPVEIDTSGGRRIVPARLGLYELLLDGTKSYRVAAIDERELAAATRELPNAADDDKLGGLAAQVDVSPQVALLLLALLAGELGIRFVARVMGK